MSIEVPDNVMIQGNVIPWADPPPSRDIEFRTGKGGQVTPEWASYMLSVWYNAERSNAKTPKFSDVLKQAVTYFMVDGGS